MLITEAVTRKRKGRYLITTIRDEFRESEFHEVDNLDTKSIEQAESLNERVFILIRQVLESNDSKCLDNQEERLETCQQITDALRSQLTFKDRCK